VLLFVLQIPTNAEEILKVCSERNNHVESDVYRDVTDGLNYKSLGNHVAFQHSFILSFFNVVCTGLQGVDISCQVSTDGVKLFKSGANDVWPIFISVNELSYKKKEGVLLWLVCGSVVTNQICPPSSNRLLQNAMISKRRPFSGIMLGAPFNPVSFSPYSQPTLQLDLSSRVANNIMDILAVLGAFVLGKDIG